MANGKVVFGHPEYGQQVHDAFPRFFEVVGRLTDSLNDLTGRAHPDPEPYQRVILNLGILNAVSMFELVTLAGNGFGLGAMKITRTVMETAINAEYLRLFPTECDLYLNWHWIEQYKLLTYVRQCAPKLFPELSVEETERIEREFANIAGQYQKPNGDLRGSWCSHDLGARAAKTGFSAIVFIAIGLLVAVIGILISLPHPDMMVFTWQLFVIAVDAWILSYLAKPHVKDAFDAQRHHTSARRSNDVKEFC